jgi:CheY-like chemotaxis protein
MGLPGSLSVLLVEDNPSDILLLQEAIVSAGIAVDLAVARNGREALDVLRGPDSSGSRLRPDVVLLDVNLPILGGREVLAEMAADPGLNTIPVVISTGSRQESGLAALYPAGRCLFSVKPVAFREMVALVHRVAQFAGSFRARGDAERGDARGGGS